MLFQTQVAVPLSSETIGILLSQNCWGEINIQMLQTCQMFV